MIPWRPILAAAVAATILGGVFAYTRFLDHLRDVARAEAAQAQSHQAAAAEGKFEIELTPTFAAEADAFSAEVSPASLTVRLGGKEGAVLLRRTDAVPAGAALRIAATGVKEGPNVFFIESSPGLDSASNAAAIHLRLFRNGLLIAERTLWADPGARVGGSLEVTVPAVVGPAEHEH